MPLPKPSKMISKRFKKPKAISPFIKPPPLASSSSREQPLHHSNLWPDIPLRKWRVRVVCTDPDATDDSSGDELDSSTLPNSARKRLIHEIFLPVPPPSPSPPQPSTPQGTRTRRREQSSNSNPIARSRKLCCDFLNTEAILQDMDVLLDGASEICIGTAHPASPHNCAVIHPNTECGAAEEEFARFLSEFVPDNGMWDDGIDGLRMPEDDEITDMLNLELDSEALTWINSLQRLP